MIAQELNSAQIRKANLAVDKKNKKFNAATDKTKRVMIAQDVLERISSKQYIAHTGTWGKFLDNSGYACSINALSEQRGESIQDVIALQQVPCECCGVGSLFLSAIAIKNEVNFKDLPKEYTWDVGANIFYSVSDHTDVRKLFGKQQLALIEVAFENGSGYYKNKSEATRAILTDSQYTKASKKYKSEDPTRRLSEIMRNIIRNKGTFKL